MSLLQCQLNLLLCYLHLNSRRCNVPFNYESCFNRFQFNLSEIMNDKVNKNFEFFLKLETDDDDAAN